MMDKNPTTISDGPDQSSTSLKCNGTGTHDDIVMESGGVVNESCPDYVEEDDVKGSIAEGYF